MSRSSRLALLTTLIIAAFLLPATLVVWSAPVRQHTPASPANAAGQAGFAAFWRLDEAGGPTYADAAGAHPAACGVACPTAVVDGQINGSQAFAAINSTSLVVAPAATFDWSNNDSFTIELWVKPDETVTCAGGDEVFIGRNPGANPSWSLGCTGGSGAAQLLLRDSSGTTVNLVSTQVITTPVWHHLALIRDGAAGTTTFIVNGADVMTSTASFGGSFSAPAAPITIGAHGASAYVTGELDEIAIHNRALSQREVNTHYYLSRPYDNACSQPVKIMPLGNSITLGLNSGASPGTVMVSYRKDLWHSLTGSDYFVDFVGSRIHGGDYAPTEGFDPYHEGHAGYSDLNIANGIVQWLTDNPADVVLVHAGTNQIDTDPTWIAKIAERTDLVDERITLIVARIIDRVGSDGTTTLFNDAVEAKMNERIANGDKIITVNLETGAGLIYEYTTNGGDMWDALHPFATGYAKMAPQWKAKLDLFMPPCVPDALAPTLTASGNDGVLHWTAINGALSYNVYRAANDPYFTPGVAYATPVTTTITDTATLGNPATNYFYTVSTTFFGSESAESKRVGAFTFAIEPGE